MAKIPVKPIVEAAKTNAPKVVEFVKKNPEKVAAAIGAAEKFRRKMLDLKEKKSEDKQTTNGKVHYRKIQFLKYHNEILPNLDSLSYIQLNFYKQEVENFIKQIKEEEENQLAINKPLHSKRSKNWNQIHVQIEDKIRIKSYEEFLKAYNSSSYESNYFDEKIINTMRNIDNKDELYEYIYRYTERNSKDIERDFS